MSPSVTFFVLFSDHSLHSIGPVVELSFLGTDYR
jgi:hypothetical protein